MQNVSVDQIIKEIVTKSEFLHESETLIDIITTSYSKDILDQYPILRAWSSAFSDYSLEDFEKRLDWFANTSIETNRQQIPWQNFLKELLQYLLSFESSTKASISPKTPAIDRAQNLLSSYIVSNLILVPEDAYSNQKLNQIREWDQIFTRWFRPTLSQFLDDNPQDSNWYPDSILIDYIVGSLRTYPVFARLFCTKAVLWQCEYCMFWERLNRDVVDIQNKFFISSNSQIISIEGNLSDPHDGCQTVRTIEFQCGAKVLYKPKSLDCDLFFFKFIQIIKEKGLDTNIDAPRVIPLGEYGWVEFMPSCKNTNVIGTKHAYDAGILLGILHLSCATDCHHENIIWGNNSIALIDCETILQAKPNQATHSELESILDISFLESCIRTGFVPAWTMNKRLGCSIDNSGLGGPRAATLRSGTIIDNSFDNGQSHEENDKLADSFGGSPFKFSHIELQKVCLGFRDLLEFVAKNKKQFLSNFKKISNFETRYVFRATEVYDAILTFAVNPGNLIHGYQFSICIDVLARAHLKEDNPSSPIFFLQTELAAMHQLDIPKFKSFSQSRSIVSARRQYEGFFENSGWQYFLRRIDELQPDVIKHELSILKGAIIAATDNTASPRLLSTEKVQHSHLNSKIDSQSNPALEIANTILGRQQISGSYNWWVFGFGVKTGRYQFTPIGLNLYDGRSGVAIFYAALAAEGYKPFKFHAEKTFEPVVDSLKRMKPLELNELIKNIGIGAVSGLGSLLYASSNLYNYLKSAHYLDVCLHVIRKLPLEIVKSDRALDVVSGNAGLILALLHLYEHTELPEVLDLALLAGNVLVSKIDNRKNYIRTDDWDPLHLTGFSHGTAGIAYALISLYKKANQEIFLSSALELIHYEQSLRSSSGTYADLRGIHTTSDQPANSWCHGLCGIIHSRLLHYDLLSQDAVTQEEIHCGLSWMTAQKSKDIDHPCCGEAGIVDTCLSAHQVLGESRFLKEGRQRMDYVINRASRRGYYGLNPYIPSDFRSVGFFQGLSGIGYQSLRSQNPNLHTSVAMML